MMGKDQYAGLSTPMYRLLCVAAVSSYDVLKSYAHLPATIAHITLAHLSIPCKGRARNQDELRPTRTPQRGDLSEQ